MTKIIVWTLAGLFLAVVSLGNPGGGWAQDGQAIFMQKCSACHGDQGKGNGPLAKTFDPKPSDFCLPAFWQGDVDKKDRGRRNQGQGSNDSAETATRRHQGGDRVHQKHLQKIGG